MPFVGSPSRLTFTVMEWNARSMEAIGNSSGTFLDLDKHTLSSPNRKLGKILVEMDIHGGLLEHIEIEWRG
jgi:hypothetical protein